MLAYRKSTQLGFLWLKRNVEIHTAGIFMVEAECRTSAMFIQTPEHNKVGHKNDLIQHDIVVNLTLMFPDSIHAMWKWPQLVNKYSLLMHCIKIKSHAKSLLNEQYAFVGGNISFLCVLLCISEEA